MAIKPSDIPSAADRVNIAKAEKELDDYLYESWKGEELYVNLPSCLPFSYRFKFLDKYRDSGWTVRFDTNTVDGLPGGPYFSFKG